MGVRPERSARMLPGSSIAPKCAAKKIALPAVEVNAAATASSSSSVTRVAMIDRACRGARALNVEAQVVLKQLLNAARYGLR